MTEGESLEQTTPLHWGTMLGTLCLVIGRAHSRYLSGETASDAIEHALRVVRVLPALEIAARVAWRMMTDPITDPAVIQMWTAALADGDVEGVAKA